MAAFPMMKLASLAINYVSKPLAGAAQRKAKESPFFRNYICIPPANLYNWCEIKMTMLSKNITGKEIHIPPLKESKAIEVGAGLVGDAVIFVIGSSILILEYFRRSHNKHMKDMEAAQQMQLVINNMQKLYMGKAELEQKVQELVNIVEDKLEVQFEPGPIDVKQAIPTEFIEPEPEPVDDSVTGHTKKWIYTALDYILNKMA